MDIFSTYLNGMILQIFDDSMAQKRTKPIAGPQATSGSAWESISQEARNWVANLLRWNPNERPSAEAVLNDPWLKTLGLNFKQNVFFFFPGLKLLEIVRTQVLPSLKLRQHLKIGPYQKEGSFPTIIFQGLF